MDGSAACVVDQLLPHGANDYSIDHGDTAAQARMTPPPAMAPPACRAPRGGSDNVSLSQAILGCFDLLTLLLFQKCSATTNLGFKVWAEHLVVNYTTQHKLAVNASLAHGTFYLTESLMNAALLLLEVESSQAIDLLLL